MERIDVNTIYYDCTGEEVNTMIIDYYQAVMSHRMAVIVVIQLVYHKVVQHWCLREDTREIVFRLGPRGFSTGSTT